MTNSSAKLAEPPSGLAGTRRVQGGRAATVVGTRPACARDATEAGDAHGRPSQLGPWCGRCRRQAEQAFEQTFHRTSRGKVSAEVAHARKAVHA